MKLENKEGTVEFMLSFIKRTSKLLGKYSVINLNLLCTESKLIQGGLNEKEKELNLCSTFSISTILFVCFRIINHVKPECAVVYDVICIKLPESSRAGGN